MNERLSVLVTSVGGRSVGHQILHALRLCGDKYRVIATDAVAFSFGLYQADRAYLVPLAAHPDYIPAIMRIIEREHVDVIMPGSEPELRLLAEQHGTLAERGCTLIANPTEVVRLCSSKWQLYQWLDREGFRTPRTAMGGDWRRLTDAVGFPVVGKPTSQTGGSQNVAILKDAAEVEHYLAEVRTERVDVILQEYVGSHEHEYTVGVLVSRDGAVIDSIVMHRNLIGLSLGTRRVINGRTYALSTGYSQGYIVRHERIQQACEALVRRIGIRGPANIQCRLADNEVAVFEVHPRFSGTTSVRADVGFNEPDVLIRNFVGSESIGRIDYQVDVAAIRAFQSIIVPLSTMMTVTRSEGA